MKKEKYSKIPISKFISDKELSKISKIIQTSESVDVAYDRIETLLSSNYKVHGLGTNRLILVHKKDKFKDLVFKVAGDSHGVEANYREFYNGDLDRSLTFSYSISDDGLFVVQEKVKTFDSKMMKDNKKKVRKMLDHLSDKILLVDCKLSNFRNFGMRKNGDIVLLDHGDTVPLPKSQTSNIVNMDEESNVSLRCKKFKNMTDNKPKPCGGKLVYSKNYDYLICKKCEAVMSVNDAYKEFYGNKNISTNIHNEFIKDLNFDPKEWSKQIKKYAKDTMSSVNKKETEEGECVMKEKIINEKKCVQMKGYWVPEAIINNPSYALMVNSMKLNKIKPKEFIKQLGLDPSEYAVRLEDHTPNKDRQEWKEQLPVAVNEVLKIMKEHEDENKFSITYEEIKERCGFVVDTIEKEKEIYKRVIGSSSIGAFIYKKDKFIIIINEEEEENEETPVAPVVDTYNDEEDESIDVSDEYDEDIEIDAKSMRNGTKSIIDDVDINTLLGVNNAIVNIENKFMTADGDWDEKYIKENYSFNILEAEIECYLNDHDAVDTGHGFKINAIPLNDIVDILSKLNNRYDNMFDSLIADHDDEFEHLEAIYNFIRKFINIRYIDSIDFNGMPGKYSIEFTTTYTELSEDDDDEDIDDEDEDIIEDDEVIEDNVTELFEDDVNDEDDENLNSEEQLYENNSNEEDEDMEDLKRRVSNLEKAVADIAATLGKVLDRLDAIENSIGAEPDRAASNDEESDDDDSDDEPSNDDIVVYPTEDNNMLTIDIDNLPEKCDIVFNKNGIFYRLNTDILNVENADSGLYDIIRATLKRFGNN